MEETAKLGQRAGLSACLLQVVMDNAVARLNSNAEKLQASGETMGDPIEISRLRREDYYSHRGLTEGDDILQTSAKRNNHQRCHQGAAAFLIMASGLEKVRGLVDYRCSLFLF